MVSNPVRAPYFSLFSGQLTTSCRRSHVDVLVDDDVRAAMCQFKEYVVTWSRMQRPFMEARGYRDLADRLAELIEAGKGHDAEARVQAGGNLPEGKLWEEALAALS